ncbi:MAG: HD domain-containing protein [Chloroflexi bacterium]|nr:HD domain-containing protein [Chloroflexota bacterium]
MSDQTTELTIASRCSLLLKVSHFLIEQGVSAYLVGGFLRDLLRGRETADVDIAVSGDAREIAAKVAVHLGGRYVLLDDANKVGRVVLAGASTAGEPMCYLDFASLRGTIAQDLALRDFTINALALDLSRVATIASAKADRTVLRGELIDPFDGQADLRRRVIRAVNDAVFKADPVRLLRAVRIAAELGFSIAPETEALVRRDSQLAATVPGERVREELLRLLALPRAGHYLISLDRLGLVTAIITEFAPARGCPQPKEHFWDVYHHSLQAVVAADYLLRQGEWVYGSDDILSAVPWSDRLAEHFAREVSNGSRRSSLLRLAALLHDIAKPQTKTIEESGQVRFLGHAQEGAAIAARILERLRFTNREIKLVETMVKYHLRPVQMTSDGLPSRRAIYRYFRDAGEDGIDTLFLSLADHLATRGPNLDMAQWQGHTGLVAYVLEEHWREGSPAAPMKLIDGHDLINVFNLRPGPPIGALLEAVREAQAAGELTTREEALAYIRRKLDSEGIH